MILSASLQNSKEFDVLSVHGHGVHLLNHINSHVSLLPGSIYVAVHASPVSEIKDYDIHGLIHLLHQPHVPSDGTYSLSAQRPNRALSLEG